MQNSIESQGITENNEDANQNTLYIETQENEKEQRRKENSDTKELDRQQKKYSSKSYKEQFAYLAIFLTGISFACNGWSLYTSFPYINSQLHLISDSENICNIFSILIISIIELLIIFSVPNALAIFVQKGWNIEAAKQAGFYLVIGVCCFSATLFFSYNGSYKTAANKIGEPVFVAPVVKTEQDINRHYDSAIQAADATAKQYYKNRVYLGKLQKSEQAELNELNAITAGLRNEKIKALNSIQSFNDAATATAKAQHDEAMKDFNSAVLSDGGSLVNYTLGAAIILIFCYYFKEKYDYNTYSENSLYISSNRIDKDVIDITPTPPSETELMLKYLQEQNQKMLLAAQEQQQKMLMAATTTDDKANLVLLKKIEEIEADKERLALAAKEAENKAIRAKKRAETRKAKAKKKKSKQAKDEPRQIGFFGSSTKPNIAAKTKTKKKKHKTGQTLEHIKNKSVVRFGEREHKQEQQQQERELLQAKQGEGVTLKRCCNCDTILLESRHGRKYCSNRCKTAYYRKNKA